MNIYNDTFCVFHTFFSLLSLKEFFACTTGHVLINSEKEISFSRHRKGVMYDFKLYYVQIFMLYILISLIVLHSLCMPLKFHFTFFTFSLQCVTVFRNFLCTCWWCEHMVDMMFHYLIQFHMKLKLTHMKLKQHKTYHNSLLIALLG